MDFHNLTRKELQTLCKRNKIPANITNVAMADALKALEIVEGLDEFMNQSQSPEKTMNKSSQDAPSTVARTSTRRKTTKEPQSTQPTTRTQRMTRRTIELDEENRNENVPDTPVIATTTTTRRRAQKTASEAEEQKNSDLLETPALQSGRRRPGVGSTRRKVEAQKEMSVQQGYGTRRSVRLLEKCMAGLSVKAGERIESEKIDGMVEENKNGQSETPAEVPLARNLSESLEDERDLHDDVLENSKCYDSDGNDCTVKSEADSHKSDNLDAKDASPDEKTVESDAYLAKSTAEKLADMSDGTIDPKGSDDVAVFENTYENGNTDEVSVAENNRGSHTDETKSVDVPVTEVFQEISEEALDHSSSAEFMEPIGFVSVEECAANGELAKLPEVEDYDGVKVSHMDSFEKMGNEESDNNSLTDEIQVSCEQGSVFIPSYSFEDPMKLVNEEALVDVIAAEEFNSNSLADKLQVSCEQENIFTPTAPNSSEDPMKMVSEEALVDVNVAVADELHVSCEQESIFIPSYSSEDPTNMVNEETLADGNVAEESDNSLACEQESIFIPTAPYSSEDPKNMVNEGALVDVNVAEGINHVVESSFQNAPKSVVSDVPIHKMLDYGDAEASVDITVNPAEEFEEALQEIPPEEESPTAATSIPLTAQFSQPTHFTPRKSSSMKLTTIPKVISDNNNKENIDNNNMKVESDLGKVKQSKNIIDEETMQKLESMSLRNLKKLTKMFDKLQITDNKPPGKTRPALQTLPQNCMSTGDAEKQK